MSRSAASRLPLITREYLERMDGCKLGSIRTAWEKARPTKAMEDIVSARPAVLGLPGVTPVHGGLPVLYQGVLVGGIGVSGVASIQDEQVATAGAGSLLAP